MSCQSSCSGDRCTGTCAGVASSTGRFLQPGDQVVGAIEKLGELRLSIG
jgi:2-keto-4-pentenoate hydratase/2-oxohepta-3-ene-1,7-dioic acid hydratase in catechol pathway